MHATDSTLFSRIAVATDFGESATHAVALAATLSKMCGSQLSIVHVVEPSPLAADPSVLRALGKDALDAEVTRVRDQVANANGFLLVGNPAAEVVSFAEANRIDLIVNGTHGGRALERWIVGSVAEKIVRAWHTALTVHGATRDFRRILVATDFSASSERALDVAVRLARASDAQLTLLHVVDDYVPLYSVDSLYASALSPSFDELASAAHTRLDEAAHRTLGLVPPPAVLVRRGKAWAEIAAETESGEHDLVVIGTHGRKAPSRWLLGSVAEKVVRAVVPPVMTVRALGSAARALA